MRSISRCFAFGESWLVSPLLGRVAPQGLKRFALFEASLGLKACCHPGKGHFRRKLYWYNDFPYVRLFERVVFHGMPIFFSLFPGYPATASRREQLRSIPIYGAFAEQLVCLVYRFLSGPGPVPAVLSTIFPTMSVYRRC